MQNNNALDLTYAAFYFMRHAQTDWNQKHLFMGWQDIPLNEQGIEQAHEAAQLLRHEKMTHIISSPLLRARKTAEIVAQNLHLPLTILQELKECSWGKYEGSPINTDLILKWLDGEPLENSESPEVFEARVMTGFKKAISIKGPVLIIAHGGVYAALQRIHGWTHTPIKNAITLYHEPPTNTQSSWSITPLNRSSF